MDYLVGSLEKFKFWTDPKLYDSFTNNIDMNSFWKMCVKKYPNNIAIENEEYKLTYAELDIKASELRSAIIEEGCKEKDKIAIIGDNTIECVYSFLASMTAGCASVIIPPYFDCNKIEKFVKSFGISAIVYEKKFEETINELKEIIPNCAFIRTDKKGLAEYSSVNSNLEDDCLIMFTGGTTGNPKGAILSHKAVFRSTLNGCIGFKSCENQRFLLVLPLFHVFGLIRCVLTCFYMGGDVYIVSSEKSIIQDIKNFRPTFIAFVPTLEGFWWQNGINGTIDYNNKVALHFISIIRLPDFVSKADFDWAIQEATKKKKQDFSRVEFLTYDEGLCVQCMHIGSYDDEPTTVNLMHDFAKENGYKLDITDTRLHHEIYLSDPRKCDVSKLKTVIRHPIKKIK